MTVTQTETSHAPTTDVTAMSSSPGPSSPGTSTTILDALGSGDHKVIGRNWILASLDLGIVMLIAGLLVGIERVETSSMAIFGGQEGMLQAWTLYRLGFVFLFLVPLLIGLATVVVPLQVGAPSVSYPRLAATAFWIWLVSAVIFAIAHLIDGGFVPLGARSAVELTIGSFFFMMVAVILASVCIVTTVITQRSEGMSLDRVPLFSWSMLVAGSVWILTLPVMLSNLVVIWFDLSGAPGEYSLLLWSQVSWVADQPQVFAFALPLLGIAGDIIPTSLSERPRAYGAAQGAIGLFGLLSFGAYAQRAFHPGTVNSPVYVLGALTMVLPLLILIGIWADAGRRGGKAPKLSTPALIAAMAIVSLLGAGAIAAVRVLGGFLGFLRWFSDGQGVDDFLADLDVSNTSIEGAVFNGVVGAGLVGAAAGLWFWAPKIFGRTLNAGIGALAALTLAGGALLTSIPDVIAGFMNQRDFHTRGPVDDGVEVLNIISLVGRAGLLAGALLLAGAVLLMWLGPRREDPDVDPDNPFGGHTLEWATSSPPPRGNFAAPMTVSSERPLLDLAGDAS